MIKSFLRTGILLAVVIISCKHSLAQSSDRMTRAEYFEAYKDMAVDEMHRSGVPASITLAQGALESGDGNSSLARRGNNHFGIKCHDDWNGKKIYQDDDARNECFRKYPSVEDSYRDHSNYLMAKTRYDFLFELDITDYKAWAKGLKKAGYATSPTYAESLIRIIEEFGLQQYDQTGTTAYTTGKKPGRVHTTVSSRSVSLRNRVKYVVAKQGDTYESLTVEFGKLDWEIPGYNDAQAVDSLVPGEVVFLQPKRNKAEAGKNVHVVKAGETMRDISQLYAIKLSRLYGMNLLRPGTEPETGTNLMLRKALKGSAPAREMDSAPRGGEEEEEIKVDLNLD
jgi:hypothetical protein